MPALTRIVAKIFGSGAGIDQISKFGSEFAGSPAFTTDPAQAQSLSNWLTGWLGAAIGGTSPCVEDMNAAFFVHSYQIAYLLQAGIPEWNSATEYFIGNVVRIADVWYSSRTDSNTNNDPASSTANWKRLGAGATQSLTATYAATLNDGALVGNAAAGSFTATLPAAAPAGTEVKVVKTDSSLNLFTIAGGGGDLINGQATLVLSVQYESYTLRSIGGGQWIIF